MTINPKDILAYIGGAALEQYGTLTRHITTVGRGGEGDQETFTRTGGAFYTDMDGQLKLTAANGPRITYPVIDGDSYLLVESTRTNLVEDSEDWSQWTEGGTCAVTNGQSDPEGGATADLLDSNAASAADLRYIVVGFTGNAEKCVSGYIRKGSASTNSIRIFDNPTTRHRVDVTWTDGVPALSSETGSGTLYPIETLANSWFRIRFSVDGVIAAGTNHLQVVPDQDGGGETMYVWGFQAEDAIAPSSYIVTTGAAASRNAEAFSVPFYAQPQELSIYSKYLEYGTLAEGGGGRIWNIGKSDDSAARLFLYEASNKYTVYHDNNVSNVVSAATAQASEGQTVEALTTIDENGSVQITQSLDGGAEAAGTASGNLALATAWSDQVLWVPSVTSGGAFGTNPIRAVIAARGSHSISDFQALLP